MLRSLNNWARSHGFQITVLQFVAHRMRTLLCTNRVQLTIFVSDPSSPACLCQHVRFLRVCNKYSGNRFRCRPIPIEGLGRRNISWRNSFISSFSCIENKNNSKSLHYKEFRHAGHVTRHSVVCIIEKTGGPRWRRGSNVRTNVLASRLYLPKE